MKKVIMLEEGDYNELLHVLADTVSTIKQMRKSFTRDHLQYLTEKAVDILKFKDSPTDDLDLRIQRLENRVFWSAN